MDANAISLLLLENLRNIGGILKVVCILVDSDSMRNMILLEKGFFENFINPSQN